MPFQSEKQRRYMHANLPKIANRWEKKYGLGGIAGFNQGGRIGFADGPTPEKFLNDKMYNELMKWLHEFEQYKKHYDKDKHRREGMEEAAEGGRIEHATGGVSNLFKLKNKGERTGFYRGSDRHEGTGSSQSQAPSSGPHGNQGSSKSSSNQGSDHGHSRFDVGSGYYGEPKTTPTPKDDPDGRTQALINISKQKKRPTYIGDEDLEGQQERDQQIALNRLKYDRNITKNEREGLEVGLGLRAPKQSSGFLKGLGTLAAGVFLRMLLPAKAAAAYKMYNTAKTVSKYANKFGITQDDKMLSLKSKFLNKDMLKQTRKDDIPKVAEKAWGPQKYLQSKKKTTTKHEGGEGVNIQEIKNLESTVSEGAQTFLSDEQREQYKLAQNKMKAALADGSYIDADGKHIDLSDEQINAMTQWITKINEMLVDPLPVGAAEGGRIDGPLMGGSRYI